jgi:hypothetical protein
VPDPLLRPPRQFSLPLSRGNDLYATFVYKTLVVDLNGNPILLNGVKQYIVTNYPDGAAVTLFIDSTNPATEVDATISGSQAQISASHNITDAIPSGITWRLVIAYANGQNVVICNGLTVRKDGHTV